MRGKRTNGAKVVQDGQDHPRVCGENVARNNTDSRKPGSPPRMRGKLNLARYNVSIYGITPAYAGKTILNRVLAR